MQPTFVVPARSFGLLLLLGFFVLGFTVAAIYRSRFRQKSTTVTSGWNLMRELCWLVVPVVTAGTFAGFSIQNNLMVRHDPVPIVIQDRDVATISAGSGSSAVQQVKLKAEAEGEPVVRPSWIEKPRLTDGISERIVLSSGQFTTREEAEQELSSKAAELVTQDLYASNSLGAWSTTWRPTLNDVRKHAVKRQFVEVSETDFVTFRHPMYRVWWQIENSPAVRAAFLPAWRRESISERIRWVGTGITGIALMTSVLAIVFRIEAVARGRYRVG